jgi:predicted ATPase/class 3 adenylate cyclase
MSEPSRSGILTFLFTDLEGSTQLWERFPEEMRLAVERHDVILKEAVKGHHGRVIKTTGDGLHAVFGHPGDGVAAALAGQQAITAEPWLGEKGQLKVRMGLHAGESQERGGDYYGPEVNLAARVMGIGYGGQVLLTDVTARLVGKALPADCTLADLGEHRLKGVSAPVRIFQLRHPILAHSYPPLKSLGTFRHNIPPRRSSFIGRRKELVGIRRLLNETRLLTLLGPGGTGKTRLMLEAAEEVIEDFPDGVWLVELAPLADPGLIPERVATALHVHGQPGRPLSDTLAEFLRSKELLLLLDNVEHLVRESAILSERLLDECPGLKILVTGREALYIEGETILQIPSLSLPDPGRKMTIEGVLASEGVQLFLERARSIRPDIALTVGNVSTVAEIVRRLDGIPLALELAAARTRMMTVDQIADRLSDRFHLLTGGQRTALPRQQTLQALIDWSWNLLDENEKILFRRLSVFSGGWSLKAVQKIAGFAPLNELVVFESLEQLINKSLVTVEYPAEGEARYGMLESIRQYSRERLLEAGEDELICDHHCKYFIAAADAGKSRLMIWVDLEWADRITLDLDNLRLAWEWALDREDIPALYALTISLAPYLYNRGRWGECEDKVGKALEYEPTGLRRETGFLMILMGTILGRSGRYLESIPWIRKTYALGKELEDPYLLTLVLMSMGQSEPDLSQRARHTQDAIAQARKLADPSLLAGVLVLWGNELRVAGRMQEARLAIEEGLEVFGNMDNASLRRVPILNLGWIELDAGNLSQAQKHFRESAELCRRANDRVTLAQCLLPLAMVLLYEGEHDAARSHLQEALAVSNDARAEHLTPNIHAWLAHLAVSEGNLYEADVHLRASLEGYRNFYREILEAQKDRGRMTKEDVELPVRPDFLDVLLAAARVSDAHGDPGKAVALLGYCEKIMGSRKFHLDPHLQTMADRMRDRFQAELGDPDFSSRWERGKRMSFQEATSFSTSE